MAESEKKTKRKERSVVVFGAVQSLIDKMDEGLFCQRLSNEKRRPGRREKNRAIAACFRLDARTDKSLLVIPALCARRGNKTITPKT